MNTLYGIVYATNSKILRRVILPESDAALAAHSVDPGETMLLVAAGKGHQHSDWVAAVAQATGATPPSAACAVVDNTNTVIAMIQADAALDSSPLGTLVQAYSPAVMIGCTYVAATALFWSAPYSIPPFTAANPGPTPFLIAAAVIPNPNAVVVP